MATETRFCAYCDQPVEPITKAEKQWTSGGAPQGDYKHRAASYNGIPSCGRRELAEHETYTEAFAQQ